MEDLQVNGFYRGVVENNQDPLKQARCQIRILGIHSPDLVDMSTDKLPWAEQASSLFCGFNQGIGMSSIPIQGTWVWVFFEKGEITKPIYFASVVGGRYEAKPEEKYGFRDQDLYNDQKTYRYPREDRVEISDTDINRLARVDLLESTIHKVINEAPRTNEDKSWVKIIEPSSTNTYSNYTYNNVIESQSGHTIELDDSPQNERIRIFHSTGSYDEIKPNGDKITKNNNYYILSQSNLNELIEGAVKKYVGGDYTEHIKGNVKYKVDGDLTWIIGGNIMWQVGKEVYTASGGQWKISAPKILFND